MNDFHGLIDQVKTLYESGLYEDVKILCDMLLAWSDSPSLTSSSVSASCSSSGITPMITDDLPSTSNLTATIAHQSGSSASAPQLVGPSKLLLPIFNLEFIFYNFISLNQ